MNIPAPLQPLADIAKDCTEYSSFVPYAKDWFAEQFPPDPNNALNPLAGFDYEAAMVFLREHGFNSLVDLHRAVHALDKPLTHCNVKECWHFVLIYPGDRCQCSSQATGRTGEQGCPGFKERKVSE